MDTEKLLRISETQKEKLKARNKELHKLLKEHVKREEILRDTIKELLSKGPRCQKQ